MYCGSCGKENSDTASYCNACGKRLVTPNKSEERMATKINPHLFAFPLWIGVFLLLGGTLSIMAIDKLPAMIVVAGGITIISFALIYFLISLYRCWTILRGFSPRTTPARAVGFSLIPFFNIYWVFVSIYGLAVDANAFTEQGGSKKKINEILSIVTCFILILPFINFIALIFMTFLIYQWAGFYNTADFPVSPSFAYPVSNKGKYLQGKFNINKVLACGIAGIVIIIIGTEMIKAKRQENTKVAAIEWCNKGKNYILTKEYDKAIGAFTSAIAFNQSYAEAYLHRGIAYFSNSQLDLAIDNYGKAISINPNYEEAYYNRAFAYSKKGLLDLEIADLNKVIVLGPSIPVTYLYRGTAYMGKGQHDLAIGDYNKAISMNTTNIEMAYGGRGLAYAAKGNLEMAIPDFQKACDMGDGLACRMLATAQKKK